MILPTCIAIALLLAWLVAQGANQYCGKEKQKTFSLTAF
jgi:hypothetical protein